MRLELIRLALATFAGIFLCAGSSSALTFFELVTGDEGLVPDARSMALGRTRHADATGAFTAATNPALLSTTAEPLLMVGGNAAKVKETRSIPAYDSFDAFIVESIYVLNDDLRFEGGVGGTCSFGEDFLPGGVGVGFSWSPVRDFQYGYVEEVRDNDAFTRPRDQLLGVHEISSTGGVNAFALGFGTKPISRLSVGGTIERLHGGFNLEQRTRFVQENVATSASYDVDDLSGWRGVLGVAVEATSRLRASMTWRTSTRLDGTFLRTGAADAFSYLGALETEDPSGDFDLRYPHELGWGATWRPRAKSLTVVRADATWTEWSQFQSDLASDADFRDLWDVRFGVEHVFYNRLPMRFGFLYTPSPKDEGVASTGFTFGGGLPAGPLSVDFAFELRNRNYRFDDLFPDSQFGGIDRRVSDRVEESSLSGFVSLGYRFPERGSPK